MLQMLDVIGFACLRFLRSQGRMSCRRSQDQLQEQKYVWICARMQILALHQLSAEYFFELGLATWLTLVGSVGFVVVLA